MVAKKYAVMAMVLVLTGSVGVGLTQQAVPPVEQGSAPTDELANLQRLLELQEQQLDLIQEQIRLTRQRILSIADPGPALAMIEVEATIIEIVTNEPGEFERLLGLPESGGGLDLVLDGAGYERLLAKAKTVEGATILTSPKVAFRDGATAQIANTNDVPFHGPDGEVKFASIGFEGQFQSTVAAANAIDLRMDVEVTSLVDQMMVTAADGTERAIPMVTGRSNSTQVTVEKGKGVVQGWLQVLADQKYTHVLCFVRPRILTPGEMKGF